MNTADIFQGSSLELKLTLSDKQTGDAINLTTPADQKLVVVLKDLKAGVLAKWVYPQTVDANAGLVQVLDATAGEYLIRVQASHTRSAQPGDLSLEFLLVEDNNNFENDQFRSIGEVSWGHIVESQLRNADVGS